jgi:hypothetical protein
VNIDFCCCCCRVAEELNDENDRPIGDSTLNTVVSVDLVGEVTFDRLYI